MRGASHRWTSSPRRGPSETQATLKTRGRPSLGQGPATESIGIRGYHLVLRARPVDSAGSIPASEFMTAGKIFMGMEEFLAARCPCCGEAEVNTRHARLCQRSDAQVNQRLPHVHALSRNLKSMFICHQVESGAPFHANRDLANGHIDWGEWTSRRYGTRVSRQISTLRRHVRGPACGGPHAGRQRGSKRISCFQFRGAQAQPLLSSGTGFLRRAELQTRHPRGGKLWAPR